MDLSQRGSCSELTCHARWESLQPRPRHACTPPPTLALGLMQ